MRPAAASDGRHILKTIPFAWKETPMATVTTLYDKTGLPRGYKVRWWTSAGQQRSQSFPLGKKGAADAFAVGVEADKMTGAELDPRAARVTVGQYVAEWQAVAVMREGSQLRVRAALTPLVVMLGDRPLARVRQSDIKAWVKTRGRSVAPITLRNDLLWVRAVFAAAVADKLIHSSPCDGIRLETPARRPMTAIDPEGVMAIAERLPARWALIGPLTARTGLRPAEALGLCAGQIDWLRRELRVDRQMLRGRIILEPKTATSRRRVPLDAETLQMLSAHVAAWPLGPAVAVYDREGEPAGEAQPIFHRGDGRPLSHQSVNQIWRRHAAGAGWPGVRLHDMRHFYASWMLRRKGELPLVSQLLGHARPSTTADIYAHAFSDRDERARALVEEIWSDDTCPVRVLDRPESAT
jgi:integrase